MKDRLPFNQYKMKRTWGRRWHTVASFFSNRDLYAHRRDFSLRVSGLNPYVAHARPVNWALRIKIAIIIVSFVATGVLTLSHPYFRVNNIDIQGIERLSEGDMHITINNVLQRRRFFVFHSNNYFLLNVDEVRDVLQEKYPLQSLIVQKSFPQNLSVVIEEKISTIIYDNGKEYSYLDGNGLVVEVRLPVEESEWKETSAPRVDITTTTASSSLELASQNRIHTPNIDRIVGEMGDFPIVYDTRGKSVAVNERALSSETAQGIFAWFNTMMRESTAIRPRYFIIDNELGDVTIETAEGWEIRGRADTDIEKQWDELQLILKNKISRRASLQYIDIRYDGRVYWQ